ncbi:hypothetical protein OIDMADRAFT_18863 [Oidiodendron maius Zn]|uniref:Uncharacterized protein n=1 Tax=Oidiodendron maius (strain Zn) TaxID=913774 RepID=A0A0C3DJP5_OIDMZ|nr:hypothetical protein OIDMADRAFT_18863 [Oidiodendron maius Zn]
MVVVARITSLQLGRNYYFANPASLTYQSNTAIGISVGLTTTLFSLKTYVRIWIKRTLALEECK